MKKIITVSVFFVIFLLIISFGYGYKYRDVEWLDAALEHCHLSAALDSDFEKSFSMTLEPVFIRGLGDSFCMDITKSCSERYLILANLSIAKGDTFNYTSEILEFVGDYYSHVFSYKYLFTKLYFDISSRDKKSNLDYKKFIKESYSLINKEGVSLDHGPSTCNAIADVLARSALRNGRYLEFIVLVNEYFDSSVRLKPIYSSQGVKK